MVLCGGRKRNKHDPDEVTVTCFGGKKKGSKKNGGTCSGILEETEGLIRDLRQEVVELRHAQSGKHEETRKLDESVRRLMEEKEGLLEERLRVREELAEVRLKHRTEEQRADKLAAENSELTRELGEQKQTTELSETLRRECKELKTSQFETSQKLQQTTAKLTEAQNRYESSMAEVDRLTSQLSNMELSKVMTENELLARLNTLKKKCRHLKTMCTGKDVLINSLKEDRSKALIQLWHTTFDQKSPPPTHNALPPSPRKQLPLAAVEPFQNDVITMRAMSPPVQVRGDLGDGGRLSPEFPQNKTMSMEFELFRKRKMAEIFGEIPLNFSLSETKEKEYDFADDVSDKLSDYVDSFLETVVYKQRQASAASSQISSVSSEIIL